MDRAYSGFGTSEISHLLTYLDTYSLTYSPGPTRGRELSKIYLQQTFYWSRRRRDAVQQQ